MDIQAILPIHPQPFVLGRPEPDATASRQNADVEYLPLQIRSVLNRSISRRLPFDWTINPYRGCELGCTYCYARYTHGFFDLTDWKSFESKIFFKQNAATVLHRELKRRSLSGQRISIGTVTDPYQPVERHFEVTRSLLEVFTQAEGLDLSITTKSPLILRDLDLLTELDRKHTVSVNITLTTVDPVLARRIEIRAPTPGARLRALETLSQEGIATQVFCMPIMPAINTDEEILWPLLSSARQYGALDVIAAPLFLKRDAKARFMPWLKEEFPHLLPLYQQLFGSRSYLEPLRSDQLLATFRRLRLLAGFPQSQPGRA
jgi:DNA repair photolyase